MKLKDAVDVVISHNAYVNICEPDAINQHFSITIFSGMLHECPECILEREFKPLTDIIDDKHRLYIEVI